MIGFNQSTWVPKRLRRSLALRMAIIMLVATLVILFAVGIYASTAIKNGIFQERLNQVLEEAATQARAAQNRFDQAPASTVEQVQSLAQDVVTSISTLTSGSSAPAVLILRNPSETSSFVINEIATQNMREVITSQLRQAVQQKTGQHWQSIEITDAQGKRHPGIAVGTAVSLPLAGAHELYLVYSLADEQAAINLVMGVLGGGGLAVLVLVAGMTWVVVYSVLVPVRRTVRTAERLAAGDLNARVLSQGQDETAQLADSFNKMANSLQSKIDTLGQMSRLQQRFVSDVSHELRTPLTTMRIADDVIYDAREVLDPAALRSAELLHDQIERFDAMLADLLEISRIDSGSARLDFEIVDLNKLVAQVVEDNATLAEKVGCRVIFNPPKYPCAAELDTRRVTRIVRNLLVNAIEHSEGNPVIITTDSSETAVALRVSDHGVGMSPEVTSRVFDRFYRADPARARTTGGTGLGLAISLEDARLSGGTLQAWGKTGYGSSFLLTLPRRHDMELGPSPLDITDYVEPTLDSYVPPQSTPEKANAPMNVTDDLGNNGEVQPC
ncbi:MtrAB system histidine kinase MtrB [Mobiluncus curtisii]|uniref:Sensor histidine kinase MtrB n=1 Tax=Mobiluncus curtisii TaxID=2051 RepID=A0A7Y0UFR3_9ACTO|nr:MtrAB system histidine kinase MtrB [Mobiluncus curtisii]MCU9986780.1 HAMP domain-containing histidine kinase [Mobiluncus curtisii]MCU9999681.1 HAMP domain-containing histidine kinase [Mobiluncus curtisii]NMW49340.1 HAMP domain-containing histidine kinase [Mobiluncus curtisii]NMW86513.1 HAMP domain-containing histidine kinase [Mobiluncus curtisii]NMX13751.1 HAMP domain-containing histidine kinase [Mobiluncus curtisii]